MSKLYSKDHEWMEKKDDEIMVGITEYAQDSLGDIVYVELPSVGDSILQGDEVAVVESAKAASDIYAPISGEITAINTALEDNPALINESPLLEGWLFKIKYSNESELNDLMDEESYSVLVKDL